MMFSLRESVTAARPRSSTAVPKIDVISRNVMMNSARSTVPVDAHAAGLTPNPCVECNRSIKFGRLLDRPDQTDFDAVATGHHARVTSPPAHGRPRYLR